MKGRKFIALILLTFMSYNIFSYVFIRIYYETSKEYITENFCVNKDKPELQCNGQCHLAKIVINEKKTESTTLTDNLLHTYNISHFSGLTFRTPIRVNSQKTTFPSYQAHLKTEHLNKYTPPPQQVL